MTTPNAAPAATERVRFVEHQGKRILYHDFTNLVKPDEALAAIQLARTTVRQQPQGSLLTLTHVTGSRFNHDVVEALKELTSGNAPFVRAGAIVGMSGLQRVVYVALTQFTGRRLPTFDTLDEAKDHLVGVA
jgi:hypothetical protein